MRGGSSSWEPYATSLTGCQSRALSGEAATAVWPCGGVKVVAAWRALRSHSTAPHITLPAYHAGSSKDRKMVHTSMLYACGCASYSRSSLVATGAHGNALTVCSPG